MRARSGGVWDRITTTPSAERIEPWAIWYGVLGGPLACSIAFFLTLFVTRGECTTHVLAIRFGIVVLAVLASLTGVGVAWRSWRSVRDEVRSGSGGTTGQYRFAAVAGLAASGLAVLVALYFLGVLLFLDRCLT